MNVGIQIKRGLVVYAVMLFASQTAMSFTSPGTINIDYNDPRYNVLESYAYVKGNASESCTAYNASEDALSKQYIDVITNQVAFEAEARTRPGAVGTRTAVSAMDWASNFAPNNSVHVARASSVSQQLYQVTSAGMATLTWELEGSLSFAQELLAEESEYIKHSYTTGAIANSVGVIGTEQ